MSEPLSDVLAVIREGASTRDQVAVRTGLPRDVVDAVIEHALRVGLMESEPIASGCTDGTCGGCAAPTGRGCGSGPVALTLTSRAD